MTSDKLIFVSIFALLLLFAASNLPAQTSNTSVTTYRDSSRTQKIAQDFIAYISKLAPGQRLSDDFVANYLGMNPNVPTPGYHRRYFDQALSSPSHNIIFIIVRTEYPEGIGKVLYSFTNAGGKIDTIRIYNDSNADAGEGSPSFLYTILDDSIIEVREIRRIYFRNTLTGIDIKYYDLRKDGKFIPIDGYISFTTRKYPELSNEKLSDKALANKSREELRLMRNEIFAAHGLIFKAEDTTRYFKSQKWYSPRYGDVSGMLNSIEKNNIDLILDFEKKFTE